MSAGRKRQREAVLASRSLLGLVACRHEVTPRQAWAAISGQHPCPGCVSGRPPADAGEEALKRWRARRRAEARELAETLRRQAEEEARACAARETWLMAELPRLRRAAQAEARRLGGVRVHTSPSGSSYYRMPSGQVLRISDHAVPHTAEREAGGWRAWSSGVRPEVIIRPGMAEEEARAEVRAQVRS